MGSMQFLAALCGTIVVASAEIGAWTKPASSGLVWCFQDLGGGCVAPSSQQNLLDGEQDVDGGRTEKMLKTLAIGMVLGIVLVFLCLWFYFTGGHAPVAVTDPPMPFERKLAHGALNAHIGKAKVVEPAVPVDEKNLLAGAEVYKQNCAVCHGLPAEPESNIAHGMFPKPPEMFHGTGVTDDPAFETYWKATNGIRLTGMPGFKGRLTDVQLWQVSQLLANADKIPPAVKAALLLTPPGAPPGAPQTAAPAPTK
jgi:thiosulfate dehydrogenase